MLSRRYRPSHAKLRSTIQVNPTTLNARCFRLTIRSSWPSRRSSCASLRLSWPASASECWGTRSAGHRAVDVQLCGPKYSPAQRGWRSGGQVYQRGRLHRLSIHDDDGRALGTTCSHPNLLVQCPLHSGPNTPGSPHAEIVIDRTTRWILARQKSPLTTGAQQVKDRIHDSTRSR